jgi:acetyl esterase/lipase
VSPRPQPPPPAPAIAYGEHPDQVANLHLPAGEGPFPVVVLVHGGFWRIGWDRTLMTALARDLAERGVAAWNVEYRRLGQDGGGWPGTLLDVAAAVDHLAGVGKVDARRAIACGHSAGGHLALWLGGRHRLPAGAPGADPVVRLRAVVGQAAVADLAGGWSRGFARDRMAGLLGGTPGEVPDRYRVADPIGLLPLGVPQVLVHGTADDDVLPEQSRAYVRAAGSEAELIEFEDADHFDVIDPKHAAWRAVVERLPGLFGDSR